MAMLREHDERSGDCLRVALYWQDDDNVLVVEVKDFKNPEREHGLTGIPPADAKLAFEHPFAWQPSTL
jgi:hypothetical protein